MQRKAAKVRFVAFFFFFKHSARQHFWPWFCTQIFAKMKIHYVGPGEALLPAIFWSSLVKDEVGTGGENLHSGAGLDFSRHGDNPGWKTWRGWPVWTSVPLWWPTFLSEDLWEYLRWNNKNVSKEAKTACKCEIPWLTAWSVRVFSCF